MIRNEPAADPAAARGAPDPLDGRAATEVLDLYIHQFCLSHHVCLKKILDRVEKEILFSVLEETNGNQREAARLLGVKPTTLFYKLQRMGIVPARHFVVTETAPQRRI